MLDKILDSLYIYDYFLEGNGYSNGKTNPKAPKSKKEYASFQDIQEKNYIIGHLKEDFIMVDIDDEEQSNVVYKIIQDLNINCLVKRTTRGKHFYFIHDNTIKKCMNEYSAIGLKTEWKPGTSNQRTLIKENNDYREILRLCDYNTMEPLPKWLHPIGKKDPELLNMGDGEGRNQALLNHILKLASTGLYKDNGGIEALRIINNYIFKQPMSEEEFNTVTRDEVWTNKSFPFVDEKERPLQVWENLQYILETNKISARYNVINREIEFKGVNTRLDYDSIITEFNTLCRVRGLRLNKDHLYDYTVRIAMENQYNPVKEFLLRSQKIWDGKDRVHDLYNTLVKEQDTEFQYTLFHKWILNCVAMAFNEGSTQQQGILVTQGPQGIGKTRWLRSITPYENWITDSIQLDPNNKDSVIRATRNWIVELGEIEGMTSKKEQATLKAYITSPCDSIRLPYTRTTKDYTRYTCYYASVNDSQFLRDDTGNRRYWVIKVTKMIHDHNIDLEQLWGQATKEFLIDRLPYWLNDEEKDILNEVNEEFRIKTSVDQKLEDGFNWDDNPLKWSWQQASHIAYRLSIPDNLINQVGKKLANMDLEEKRVNKGKYYKVPTFKPIYSQPKIM